MTDLPDNSKAWFDDELRRVPLPAGLVERLQAIAGGADAQSADAQMDAALCAVSLPEGMLGRLKEIPRDAAIDERLRDVPAPGNLAAQLKSIAAYSDDAIDEELATVPLPAGLTDSLRAVVRTEIRDERLQRRRLVQFALAASLLVTIGGSLFTSTAWMVSRAYQNGASDEELAEPRESLAFEFAEPAAEELIASDLLLAEALVAAPTIPLAVPTDWPTGWQVDLGYEDLAGNSSGLTQSVMKLFSPNRDGFDPLADVFLAKHNFLAMPSDDSRPELQTVEWLAARGTLWPRVKEYDLLRVILDGKNPLLSPAAHEELKTALIPLAASTAGFDRARQAITAGRMPAADELRSEDFLAAMDYEFDLPTDLPLGLRTAAGPSPWREPGVDLLQIGVQAGHHRQQEAERAAVRLTVAIDVSATLERGSRLEEVRRALRHLAQALGPDDRLSLVAFNETAEVLIEDAGRENLGEIQRAIASLQAKGATNLAAGLREAALVAMRGGDGEYSAALAQRVILLTDGPSNLDADVLNRLELLVEDAAHSDVRLEIIDLRPEANSRLGQDSRLAHLAQLGGGRVRGAVGAEALRFGLVELLTGRSAVIASAARLSVTFNPKTVAEYRLIGHEPTIASLTSAPLETDLREGEAATALFEVKLLPTGGDDIATATITWRDPVTSQEQTLTQRVSRLQFATSLAESPVSLQRAAIAAETAEVLRLAKSPAARMLGLNRIRDVASRLSSSAQAEPALADLLRLIATQPASKPRGL